MYFLFKLFVQKIWNICIFLVEIYLFLIVCFFLIYFGDFDAFSYVIIFANRDFD